MVYRHLYSHVEITVADQRIPGIHQSVFRKSSHLPSVCIALRCRNSVQPGWRGHDALYLGRTPEQNAIIQKAGWTEMGDFVAEADGSWLIP
jgi:hypothetical protein